MELKGTVTLFPHKIVYFMVIFYAFTKKISTYKTQNKDLFSLIFLLTYEWKQPVCKEALSGS